MSRRKMKLRKRPGGMNIEIYKNNIDQKIKIKKNHTSIKIIY